MKYFLMTALAIGLLLPTADAGDKPEYLGKVVRLDPRIDKLIPKDAKIEKLAEGFEWAEGPAWDKEKGHVVFSDVITNTAYKWSPEDGLSVFMKPSGYTGAAERGGEPGSNGLAFDAQNRLVMCEHGDHRVSRVGPDGKKTTLANEYKGKRLNSPNDLAIHSNGDIYFTDPPYGLEKRQDDPARELDFCGVYRISTDGKLTLLTKEMTFPNGIAFSPDEKTLYVAQSDPNASIWKTFPVKEDGTLGKGKLFFDATDKFKAGKPGLPDGMAIDQHGNLFATGPGGVLVFDPDGTHLGTIVTGEKTANCGFGEDGTVLYLTADMYLCRIPLSTKGLGF